jgi:hypothetical protein
MKTHRKRRFSSIILDLGTRWEVSGELHLSCLTSRETVHWTRGWVGPRASLVIVTLRKVSCPYHKSTPGLPAHSLWLWWMSYPSSPKREQCDIFAESRDMLLGNGTINTSLRQQWHHTTVKELQETVFSMGPLQLPRHIVTWQLQEKVFSV